MPKAKLDHVFTLTAQCEEGKKKTDWYDQTVTGFVLECRSTGGRTYYLRYEDAAGRQKQHKIGRYEDISFAAAKKAAQKLRSEVVMGGDPGAAKAAIKAVPTYGELADQHVAHARTHMRSIKTLEGYMKRIRARWQKVRLTDIKQQDVAQWLAGLRAEGLAPATVEKARVIFNRSFQLGEQWGVPGCDKNPVKGVPRPRFSNARERFINDEEAARLLKAAAETRNPLLPAIVSLLLLSGMRVSELLSMRWEHVDTAKQTLFIAMSKTGRSRRLPLSKSAVDIIDALPRKKDAVFLFPNPQDGSKHLTTIKHSWQSARDAAGLQGLRIHDLRHSAASALINNGVGLITVGKLLGHANVASTARYSHLADDTLMLAVEAGAAKLKIGIAA